MENVGPLLIFIFQDLSNDILEFNMDHIFVPKIWDFHGTTTAKMPIRIT
jgi:hypothetical protein